MEKYIAMKEQLLRIKESDTSLIASRLKGFDQKYGDACQLSLYEKAARVEQGEFIVILFLIKAKGLSVRLSPCLPVQRLLQLSPGRK
jgi:hypothetical protein